MNRQLFIHNVEACQRAVRRFLTALCCGDTAHADDLAQDTFVKAYISIDKLADDSKFRTWIFRIAYTTFLNDKRNASVITSLSEADSQTAPEAADDVFRYAELYEGLTALNPKERTVILLHYMQGYSIAEISEIMSLSVDSVKQRLSRGRKHLKNIIADYGE